MAFMQIKQFTKHFILFNQQYNVQQQQQQRTYLPIIGSEQIKCAMLFVLVAFCLFGHFGRGRTRVRQMKNAKLERRALVVRTQ